jgi:hypothetical protein
MRQVSHLNQIKDWLTPWVVAFVPLMAVLATGYLVARGARKERKLSLKREIYLAALEAASAGMIALERLTDPEPSEVEVLRLYREKAPSIVKVYLVANKETLKAFTRFRDELTIALSRAVIRRSRICEKKDLSDPESRQEHAATLREWNQAADDLGRLFTSVLSLFRTELDLPINEEELHRMFDPARKNRRDIVEERARLRYPPAT